MVADPACGLTRPSSIVSVVVLPAPLGPGKPVTAPGRAEKLSPSDSAHRPEGLGQTVGLDHGSPTAAQRTGACDQLVPGGRASSQDWKPVSADGLIASSTGPRSERHSTITWPA